MFGPKRFCVQQFVSQTIGGSKKIIWLKKIAFVKNVGYKIILSRKKNWVQKLFFQKNVRSEKYVNLDRLVSLGLLC